MYEEKHISRSALTILFVITDIILIGCGVLLNNYLKFSGIMATLTANNWIILLVLGLALSIVSILVVQPFGNTRAALIDGILIIVSGLWFGIARKPIMVETNDMEALSLFNAGSVCILLIIIVIQIDLLISDRICGYLTMDGHKSRKQVRSNQKRKESFFDDFSEDEEEEFALDNAAKMPSQPVQQRDAEVSGNVLKRNLFQIESEETSSEQDDVDWQKALQKSEAAERVDKNKDLGFDIPTLTDKDVKPSDNDLFIRSVQNKDDAVKQKPVSENVVIPEPTPQVSKKVERSTALTDFDREAVAARVAARARARAQARNQTLDAQPKLAATPQGKPASQSKPITNRDRVNALFGQDDNEDDFDQLFFRKR